MAAPRHNQLQKHMVSEPLVSVIVPCYNYGKYLGEALESVAAQRYQNWECIVVDDGSTDDTNEVGNRYAARDKRFKYIHQQNSGVSAARNAALKASAGEYIQLLDADDLIEPDKLKLQAALLNENKAIDLVYSSFVVFKEAAPTERIGPKLMLNKNPATGRGEQILTPLVDDNLFLPGCVMFRRTLYEDVGGFTEGIEGIEDWDFFYRAVLAKKNFHHDGREGTRLLVRAHATNASSNELRMLTHKLKARKRLMAMTTGEMENPKSIFARPYLQRVYKAHKGYLNRDAARLHLFYGNLAKGCVHALKHAFFSGRYYFAFYDGGYWIKERLKHELFKSSIHR